MIKALVDPDQLVSTLMLYVIRNFVPRRGMTFHAFLPQGAANTGHGKA
jgi:hypothetical protein